MTNIQTAHGPLTVQEIRQYRAIVKSAIVFFLVARLGRPTGPTEVAKILDIDRGTAANHLDSLCMIGLMTRTDVRDGYRLSNDGKQLMLQVPGNYLLDEMHIANPDHQPHVLTLHTQDEGAATPALGMGENPALFALPEQENSQTGEIPPLNGENFPVETLKKIEEESFIKLKDESSTTSLSATNVEKTSIQPETKPMPTAQQLLEVSDLLFEQSVVTAGLPLEKLSTRLVLGWLAQAKNESSRLRLPAGLVYVRLRDGVLPKRKYMAEPEKYLPREYLVAVGLAEPETFQCPECGQDFGEDHNARDEHYEAVCLPVVEERYRIENERMLAEMEQRKIERLAQATADARQRQIEQAEARCLKYGQYFADEYALFSALGHFFETDMFALQRGIRSSIVNNHTYLLTSQNSELIAAMREDWEIDSAAAADEQYPGLVLKFETRTP